ncbi:hypothetical protein DMN91_002361 [Ooceraea biroi]|uniref:Uncharacterized protein n=2 Tax=Ooceraea biroi TaxID=2015173 RepID=A0A3L8E1C9_OOCBI|nr:uncharacterized protein LOC105287935 isoform X1 [Ooceraea biroi]RLU26195.1 hypothetical protein DMN91_002361 [Ooceraea biroi]
MTRKRPARKRKRERKRVHRESISTLVWPNSLNCRERILVKCIYQIHKRPMCARYLSLMITRTIMKSAIMRLLLLLLFYDHVASLIIPEELPTILSLIYSNIPPIKKGTDSRLGVGFRLGEHADFQILIELGPQTETDPVGVSGDSKRRRDAMLTAAMKGELGPLAQAVARYQVENRIHKEMNKLKVMQEKLKDVQVENKPKDSDTVSSNWLTKWKEEMSQSPKDNVPLDSVQSKDDKVIQQRIGRPVKVKPIVQTDKLDELTKLYKLQNVNNTENLA